MCKILSWTNDSFYKVERHDHCPTVRSQIGLKLPSGTIKTIGVFFPIPEECDALRFRKPCAMDLNFEAVPFPSEGNGRHLTVSAVTSYLSSPHVT
jgi:hypothetical protein